jgi:hypothetical protein
MEIYGINTLKVEIKKDEFMVEVNYWAVLVAGVSSIVLGSLWYGPLFGKPWMAIMGYTQQSMEAAKNKGMTKIYLIAFGGALVMAYVLTHSIHTSVAFYNVSGYMVGLQAGFWNWLGFIAPVTLGVVLWEGKPWKLWLINAGYYLVLLLIVGLILALWR